MRITKEFNAFGVKYKTTQFSAVRGIEIMNMEQDKIHPCELLSETFVKSAGAWLPLSDADNVNRFVMDGMPQVVPNREALVSPLMVLNGITSLVTQFNFEFVERWKGTKIPRRFLDESEPVVSGNVEPLILQLSQDGVATLRELEEYYSLEDAFKLFDIIMVKGINQAIAQESATKKSRR